LHHITIPREGKAAGTSAQPAEKDFFKRKKPEQEKWISDFGAAGDDGELSGFPFGFGEAG